jgi:transposase-like protein
MELQTTGQAVRNAIKEVKGFEWEGDYRPAARKAVKEMLEGQMDHWADQYLAEMEAGDVADRRNGWFERRLTTEVGDVVLAVKRTRTASACGIFSAYARRPAHVDRAILDCFLLGASTRKVGRIMAPYLGQGISASTVSRIAKQLDGAVAAYHGRPLQDRYRFLMFDGVVLKRKSGAGAQKRVVLVALGLTPEGKKEVIDFYLAQGESQAAWEAFLNDLYRRGLNGKMTELVATDGGKGLLAALPLVFPRLRVQRCWAHKTRNVLNCVRKTDQQEVKADLHKISHAKNLNTARRAMSAFHRNWIAIYPKASACLARDSEALLAFFRIKEPKVWSQIRTTNAIERRFREVRRRTRPMGVFSDSTSMERILYAVFSYENTKQGTGTPIPLTQNS